MVLKVFGAQKSTIWLAIGHGSHILAAQKQEFARDCFLGKFDYSPVKLMEVEYYLKPIEPNIIKPEII